MRGTAHRFGTLPEQHRFVVINDAVDHHGIDLGETSVEAWHRRVIS